MKNLKATFYHIFLIHTYIAKIILVLAITVITVILYNNNALKRLEFFTVDYRFKMRPSKIIQSDIVFIDMAEDSIEAIGIWPWPRKWHATLVSALSEYSPKLIAFDVLFSEPQDETDDAVFEEAIKRSSKVYLPLAYNLTTQDIKVFNSPKEVVSILRPIDKFRKYIKGTGHINAFPDPDGILRRVPPVITYQGNTTYQFGFKIGCDILGIPEKNITFYPKGHRINLKKSEHNIIKVPLDENNQLIVNWKGTWAETFKHYSYIDVIRSYAMIKEGKKPIIDLNVFKNKICIIGLTASGLIDIKPTPLEKAYPAVATNALAIYSVLNKDFLRETSVAVNIVFIFLVTIIVVPVLSNLKPLHSIGITILLIAGYFVFSIIMFSFFNVLITTFYPIFSIFLSYILTTSYSQTIQTIEKAMLFKQATHDSLTNLYNKQHFNMLYEAEFQNVATYKARKLSVLLFDIDDFKHINDTFGHLAGDTVIIEVGAMIQSKCRSIDVVGRYGGEEFIAMLVGTKEENALRIAEEIRSAIESKKFKFGDKINTVTVSVGAAEYSDEKLAKDLVDKADKALYRAKRGGKNRVCLFGGQAAAGVTMRQDGYYSTNANDLEKR